MGVIVREKIKGSGVYWIFASYKSKRKSFKIGKKELAKKVADELRKNIIFRNFNINEIPNIYSQKGCVKCKLYETMFSFFANIDIELKELAEKRKAEFKRAGKTYNKELSTGYIPTNFLTDGYIKKLLIKTYKIKELAITQEMIQLKRANVLFKRKLRKLRKEDINGFNTNER